jgi:DNA-binding response OmpR family regulator
MSLSSKKPLSNPVLIAEDDKKTASLVSLYLEKDGFQTIIAHDGKQALDLAREKKPVIVILDIMLPLVDGWDVCREIRSFSDVPIIMLTARREEMDRISGLTMGADDYVVKPFSPRELVARVRAVLRRGRTRQEAVLTQGDLTMDLEKRKVSLKGKPVFLTPHEYRLLEAFMSAPGKSFTREELLEHLYPKGEAVVIDRVVDVHIGKLRQKIEMDPASPKLILTVRGMGYRFAEP